MSSVRQYQRRALEALKPKKRYDIGVSSLETDEYYLEGKRIYPLGVSEGLGTCSDLYGVNIAVFGWSKLNPPQFPRGCEKKIVYCYWAALLREPTKTELANKSKEKEYLTVELIEPINLTNPNKAFITLIEKNDKHIRCHNFGFAGKKKIYVNTIC